MKSDDPRGFSREPAPHVTVTRCMHLVYFPVSAGNVSAVPYTYAVQRAIPSARARFASPSPLDLLHDGLRNIDRMSIHPALTGGC